MTTKKSFKANDHIPRASAPNALSLYDGTNMVGTIVAHDGAFFVFDPAGILIGEYESQREAMLAPRAAP
jgi:hypothetical protein